MTPESGVLPTTLQRTEVSQRAGLVTAGGFEAAHQAGTPTGRPLPVQVCSAGPRLSRADGSAVPTARG